MADSSESPRKTLDDIRRELDAEYPCELAPRAPVLIADDDADAAAVERSASRRRELVRRYLTVAVLGGVGALLLLIAGAVVVSLKPMRPNAVASGRESGAPDAVVVNTAREARDARPAAPIISPAIVSELQRELKALRRDLKALAEKLDRSDSRVAGMESRVRGVESSMRRRASGAAVATHPPERTVAVPQATAPAVETTPSAAPPAAVPDPVRLIPVTAPAPERSTASHDARPAVQPVVAPEARISPPPTSDVSESRPPSAAPREPATFGQKLRAEWRTIKQGFATARDDFKAVVRDFGRKAAGE